MKHFPFHPIRHFLGFIVVVVVLAGLVAGCSDTSMTPQNENIQDTPIFTAFHPEIRNTMAIQLQHTPDFMRDPEVVGTATGLTEDGRPAILVFLKTKGGGKAIGDSVDGIPVVKMVTGPFRALVKPPPRPPKPEKIDHKAKQDPPIKLGTSGGWRYDLANGYCCGGTLGALIQVGGQKRILSNYHVFEADIVDGGNGRQAETGDYVIQPGLIDVGCNAGTAQNVATLVVSHSLPNNNVDCSSATIIDGMVDPSGAILGIGTLSSTTVDAFIGQDVKKSGRTTGLTRSSVDGLNATVSIQYENECAGSVAFTKIFTGQIIIKNRASKFLGGGDSGSLMVEDITTDPCAVGLLFAGSRTLAVANPIDEVLDFFNATMVGN